MTIQKSRTWPLQCPGQVADALRAKGSGLHSPPRALPEDRSPPTDLSERNPLTDSKLLSNHPYTLDTLLRSRAPRITDKSPFRERGVPGGEVREQMK